MYRIPGRAQDEVNAWLEENPRPDNSLNMNREDFATWRENEDLRLQEVRNILRSCMPPRGGWAKISQIAAALLPLIAKCGDDRIAQTMVLIEAFQLASGRQRWHFRAAA